MTKLKMIMIDGYSKYLERNGEIVEFLELPQGKLVTNGLFAGT